VTLYSLYVTVLLFAPTYIREPLVTGMRLDDCRTLAHAMAEQALAESINIITTCKAEPPPPKDWRES
jgi:hypothetical protein